MRPEPYATCLGAMLITLNLDLRAWAIRQHDDNRGCCDDGRECWRIYVTQNGEAKSAHLHCVTDTLAIEDDAGIQVQEASSDVPYTCANLLSQVLADACGEAEDQLRNCLATPEDRLRDQMQLRQLDAEKAHEDAADIAAETKEDHQ